MEFDMSLQFNVQDPAIFRKWMTETVAFAALSNGGEVDEDEISGKLNSHVFDRLVQTSEGYPFDQLVKSTLLLASNQIDECSETNMEPFAESQWVAIHNWMVKTLACVKAARGEPVLHEHIEMEVSQKLVEPVQGSKSKAPSRADLDLLVRKTVRYALGKLESVAV